MMFHGLSSIADMATGSMQDRIVTDAQAAAAVAAMPASPPSASGKSFVFLALVAFGLYWHAQKHGMKLKLPDIPGLSALGLRG